MSWFSIWTATRFFYSSEDVPTLGMKRREFTLNDLVSTGGLSFLQRLRSLLYALGDIKKLKNID